MDVICSAAEAETRLNDTFNTTIRRYSIYRRDLPSEHPAGGVCIIVNNQIPHSSVQLNSSLQAIAVRVSMHKVLTICSIYIPPSSPIIAANVEDLLRQLPAPALICGDFNGHNLLWGSRVTNPRGRTIENIILHNNLCLYNDTSMTYLDLSAGTYSALDLTLCHPSLLQDFTWMVDGDLHTSDHFPIHVKGNGPPIKGRPQRWKLHKADWTMFKQLCAEQLNISSLAEISDQYSEFITILLEVAEISIPKTSQYPKRFNKPWFNKDCKDAVRERKRLLRKFSLRPTSPIRDKSIDLKETKDLYDRLMVLARSSRDVDQKEAIGNFEFTLTPRALFAPSGSLLPCNDKSKFIHALTNLVPKETTQTPIIPDKKIAVIDGMVLVQKLSKKSPTMATVKDLSETFYERLTNLTQRYDEVIVVFDTYKPDSLKETTRQKRRQGKDPVQYQVHDDTNIKHLSRFLSHDKTKAA
ncbi:RNA-directed DNA polymerase from mobile element jockey [Nymphon striatum]|nr:RNA-directed DNA polymerase from mobile element jockey [Nymphon striatum]